MTFGLSGGIAITLFAGLVIIVGEVNGQNQSSIDKGKYMNQDEVQIILGYCYQHADRPNPVQDLLDKGLVNSTEFTGETCASVKQAYDQAQKKIRALENSKINAESRCRSAYDYPSMLENCLDAVGCLDISDPVEKETCQKDHEEIKNNIIKDYMKNNK